MLRFLALPALSLTCFAAGASAADTWSQWRGSQQSGVARGGDYPTRWSNQEGIAWQIDLPGRGGSTPVASGEQIFVTSGVDQENTLFCLKAGDGSQQWSVALGEDRGNKHRKGSGSNPSPVTDGQRVFAYFRSGDLACVNTQGDIQWQVNLQDEYGEDTLWWDLGTSPILTDQAVVVAVMQTGPSYVVALDKETGKPLWKTDRMVPAPEEAAQSYATPLLMDVDGRSIIAVMGADHLTLHDAEDGRELAKLGGFNPAGEKFFRSIASPVAVGSTIICPYARGETLTAVDAAKLLAGEGDDAIVWFRDNLGADVPTPAAKDGRVFLCRDKGGVVCLDAQTGKDQWTVEIPRSRHNFSSSPLVTDDHLYVTREDGTTFVIAPLDDGKLIATNEAGSGQPYTVASLVPYQSDFLLRTADQLLRIRGKK